MPLNRLAVVWTFVFVFAGWLWCGATPSVVAQTTAYVGAPEPSTAPAVYGQGVRETDWQTAAAERAGFHLPPGFEIELFAGEPQIAKPLNMAWDPRGRLWVTCTVEYPYPAKPGTVARDTIKILEDTNGDGTADKVTTFADQLNIPIGILPVADGVICFSIPSIWHLKDTDGDDHVDERIELLGPFDTTRDTHGMVNSLSRGSDGWIYACHGFNNQSRVTAQDGSSVALNSGNTFRFRQDGSRIEQVTQGQVNPFGMTRDAWGNWYTADCHSKPLTALLAGACYPSFGRPHDGLGFAPDMMQHLHGSTAICGLNFYQAEHFPEAYRGLFYSGNVMTSRINCNALEWSGATATAREQADFLTSDDPWFRPVDIQLGPDGALYVADFYNKIIGHYEVPLEHPDRDRESGRIWRISYRGTQPHQPLVAVREAVDHDVSDLAAGLASPNLTRRRLVIDRVVEQVAELQPKLESMARDPQQPSLGRLSAFEALQRGGALTRELLLQGLSDADPFVRELALRLAAARPRDASPQVIEQARRNLDSHQSPHVRKSAAELIGHLGQAADVKLLLHLAKDSAADDPALSQVARIAARNLLRDDSRLQQVAAVWIDRPVVAGVTVVEHELAPWLARLLPGLNSSLAAETLLGYVGASAQQADRELVEQAIQAASRHADDRIVAKLLPVIDRLTDGDVVQRSQYFQQLLQASRAAGSAPSVTTRLQEYGLSLQQQLIAELQRQLATHGRSVDWIDQQGGTWEFEARQCRDGTPAGLMSSLTRSEQYTGVLRSEGFACPSQITFWLAGHDGPPGKPAQGKNSVSLVELATGQALATATPPRNDVAVEVTWQLDDFAGRQVRLEVTDGDSGGAYAWLAVGRFSSPLLATGQLSAVRKALLSNLQLGLVPSRFFEQLKSLDLSLRQAASCAAAALQGLGSQPAATLATQAVALNRSDLVLSRLLTASGKLAPGRAEDLEGMAKELCSTATASEQAGLAKALLASSAGCELLRAMLEQGMLSPLALKGVQSLLPGGLQPGTREYLEQQTQLAATLPSPSAEVGQRISRLPWESADLQLGQQIYKQHCGVCHRLGTEGNLIGPQLDGAVVRGIERLSEDILDPNRNVDRAFRLTSLLLDDDSIVSGLVRDEDDGSVSVTGQDGKTQRLAADVIVQRRESPLSLMPSNFGEVLSDEQLAALLTFLARSTSP